MGPRVKRYELIGPQKVRKSTGAVDNRRQQTGGVLPLVEGVSAFTSKGRKAPRELLIRGSQVRILSGAQQHKCRSERICLDSGELRDGADRAGSPQIVRTSSGSALFQAFRNAVQLVIEQAGVHVQGHGR